MISSQNGLISMGMTDFVVRLKLLRLKGYEDVTTHKDRIQESEFRMAVSGSFLISSF